MCLYFKSYKKIIQLRVIVLLKTINELKGRSVLKFLEIVALYLGCWKVVVVAFLYIFLFIWKYWVAVFIIF